ncbi:hypothetical protein QYZ87_09330 [Porphyromonadaceae bacterium W3.11]|nr:hypothetical protein [Porphyromonadaceae bacterium W3.11]
MSKPQKVTQLIEQIIEIAIAVERELYKKGSNDVSNSYCLLRIFARYNMLQLRVPQTWQQSFISLILGVLKDQEKEMGELVGYI